MEMKTLRLILGDQLNSNHWWFETKDDSVTYLLMEIRTETDYATHHIQKIVGFFSAMKSFANELMNNEHQVIYINLNDENNLQSFEKNIHYLIEKHQFTNFEYQLPDEFRLDELLKNFCNSLSISNSVVDSEHFYTSRTELGTFFEGKKNIFIRKFLSCYAKKTQCFNGRRQTYNRKMEL